MNRGSSSLLPALVLVLLAAFVPPLGAAPPKGAATPSAPAASGLDGSEHRAQNIDVILLVDKSLSMAGAEGAVKRYLAGEVIGPLLVPGDRLIVETFYGKIDRLFGGTIRSEEDKAGIVRSLQALVADGRFTDIGLALDRAKADVDEFGAPERPKYVLLLTDERQEAPAGTKYYSPTFKLDHPALKYIRRVDLGPFRAITVGFDVGERVDAATPGVMRLLTEMPAREARDFPALPAGTDPGLSGAVNASSPGQAGAPGQAGGAGPSPKGPGMGLGSLAILGASVLFALFLAVVLIRVVQLRKRRPKDKEET